MLEPAAVEQNTVLQITATGPSVTAISPDGEARTIPAFQSNGEWCVRYSSHQLGRHELDGHPVDVTPYTGTNPLLAHGPLEVSADRTKMVHCDGTPFLWLADTWWLAFVKRFTEPDFFALADQRADQGFSVVQLVAGLYPETPPLGDASAGDHGHPWTTDFAAVHEPWWDAADRRIQGLVDRGIVPCVVGAWGSVAAVAGEEVMKEHWRTIIARWGALPTVWCLAGEARLPLDLKAPEEDQRRASDELQMLWEGVAQYVRETDGFGRLLTAHPSPGDGSYYTSDVLRDPSTFDIEMLQTGHTNLQTATSSLEVLDRGLGHRPQKPVFNSEVCYEGIMGASWHDVQRLLFWTHMLRGAAGHSYGAQGIWSFNEDAERGVGGYWGPVHWREAIQLPGAAHVGIGRRILEELDWQSFEPHPEWIEPSTTTTAPILPHAAGIPGTLRVVYFPSPGHMPAKKPHGFTWIWQVHLRNLEAGEWTAEFVNPRTGEWLPERRIVLEDGGDWCFESSPDSAAPTYEDWVLVVRRVVD